MTTPPTGPSESPGPPDPPAPGPPPPRGPRRPPPGIRDQFEATRAAAMRLVMAHVELGKAEIAAIGGQIARVAALAGVAIALVITAAFLFVVGTALFLGEWILGSMGWGVLHGILAFSAVAMTCILAALGVAAQRIVRSFATAVVIGIVVGVGLGLDLPNRAYTAIGDATLVGIEPGIRPLVVGLIVVGVLGLLVGILGAWRGKAPFGPSAAGGLVAGILLGAFTAITFGPQVGAGVGIAVGYIAWMALDGHRRRPDRRRRRGAQGSLLPQPDHRDQQGDARVATETDAARDRVIAARAELAEELENMEASVRAAVDIPARIKRSPAKAAAIVGGVGFLALKGPKRMVGAARRAVRGPAAEMPKSMLPGEIEKTLRSLGDDGNKVRGKLERDFAAYAKSAEKDRAGRTRGAGHGGGGTAPLSRHPSGDPATPEPRRGGVRCEAGRGSQACRGPGRSRARRRDRQEDKCRGRRRRRWRLTRYTRGGRVAEWQTRRP